jgi:hypothetical protein
MSQATNQLASKIASVGALSAAAALFVAFAVESLPAVIAVAGATVVLASFGVATRKGGSDVIQRLRARARSPEPVPPGTPTDAPAQHETLGV